MSTETRPNAVCKEPIEAHRCRGDPGDAALRGALPADRELWRRTRRDGDPGEPRQGRELESEPRRDRHAEVAG